MGEGEREGESAVSQQERGPEEIRQEIEETREELGETVNALSEKADVKARARERISEIRGTIAGKAEHAKGRAQGATPGSFDVDQAGAKAREAAGAAQQNPAALAGGAFLLGLLVGRALGRRAA